MTYSLISIKSYQLLILRWHLVVAISFGKLLFKWFSQMAQIAQICTEKKLATITDIVTKKRLDRTFQ